MIGPYNGFERGFTRIITEQEAPVVYFLPLVLLLTEPLPVNNVTLDDSTIFTLTISWENPIDGSFDMFLIKYASVRSPGSVMALDPINTGTNTATIPNLQPGTLYNIMVYALAGEEPSDATEITAMTSELIFDLSSSFLAFSVLTSHKQSYRVITIHNRS